MINPKRFIAVAVLIAFVTKVLGEFVHEVLGHGFFVILFGGEITNVHISLLWPYELSQIEWSGSFLPWQQAWLAGGGILVCLLVSGLIQALLLFDMVKDWRLSFPLFWLAFWTFLNPTGYLIISGIRPFGDMLYLISAGVLTRELSLLIGLSGFFAAFLSLSRILMTQLSREGTAQRIGELRFSLALFWAIIPMVTSITCLGMGLQLHYSIIFIALALIPVPVATLLPNFLQRNPFSNKIRSGSQKTP